MDSKKVKFAAYNSGLIMTGDRGLSQNQADDLNFLEKKNAGKILHKKTGKPLAMTGKNADDLSKYKTILAQKYFDQMSKTAKKVVFDRWAKKEYGYQKSIGHLDQIKKGNEVEHEILRMVSRVYPEFGFLTKEKGYKTNEWFIGACDAKAEMINVPEIGICNETLIIELKASENFHSFMNVDPNNIDPTYYGQMQIYMDLYEANYTVLIYGLINTPSSIMDKKVRQLAWQHGGMELAQDDPIFLEEYDELVKQNTYDQFDDEDRLRSIFVKKDEVFLNELKYRIEEGARVYYDTLSIQSPKYNLYQY